MVGGNEEAATLSGGSREHRAKRDQLGKKRGTLEAKSMRTGEGAGRACSPARGSCGGNGKSTQQMKKPRKVSKLAKTMIVKAGGNPGPETLWRDLSRPL